MKSKKPKEESGNGYWPYRPGYNSLLGYKEGKLPNPKLEKIKVYATDREVKDGKSLNK